MKVFLDTNVVLEYLMRREQSDAVEKSIDSLKSAGDDMYISVGGFYSILYVLDNFLRKELEIKNPDRIAAIRVIAGQLLEELHVAEHDNSSLLNGINDELFVDLEDSCQYQAALKAQCKYFLTFNLRHYPIESNDIRVLTPNDFVSLNLL